MSGADWALGINSADGRTLNQMHIHLTRLYGPARDDIDNAAKTGKLAKSEQAWVNSPIEVTGHDQHGNQSKHTYRAWNADGINHNYFAKLNDDIVKPLQKQGKSNAGMRHETLLITLNHPGQRARGPGKRPEHRHPRCRQHRATAGQELDIGRTAPKLASERHFGREWHASQSWRRR